MKEKNVEVIADAVIALVKAAIDPLNTRIAALEARPLQKWAGVFIEGASYSEASLTTRAGSLWCAMKTTTTTPGEPGSDWVLIVKRGTA
jgi:hypothetical protein